MRNQIGLICGCIFALLLIKKINDKKKNFDIHDIFNHHSFFISDIYDIINHHSFCIGDILNLKLKKSYKIQLSFYITFFMIYKCRQFYIHENKGDNNSLFNNNKLNKIKKIFDNEITECKKDINYKYTLNHNHIIKNKNCVRTLRDCLIKYIQMYEKNN